MVILIIIALFLFIVIMCQSWHIGDLQRDNAFLRERLLNGESTDEPLDHGEVPPVQ